MKGKNFLKVCGILMIIGGALSIIVSGLVGLIGAITASVGSVDVDGVAIATSTIGGIVIAAAVVSLIAGVLELIAGIVGVKNCARPEKATSCIVWGFIVLAVQIISLIMSISGTSGAGNIIISIIAGIAIPVLYLIGAFLNKKSATAA